MELFERVKTLWEVSKTGGTPLPEELGVNEHTLRGYLKPSRQDNLWPFLGKILEKHPEVSRNWLYFDEGPFLIADAPDDENVQDLLDEMAALRERNRLLSAENVELRQKAFDIQSKYVTALEELRKLEVIEKTATYQMGYAVPGTLQEDAPYKAGPSKEGNVASISHGVAPSFPPGNEE